MKKRRKKILCRAVLLACAVACVCMAGACKSKKVDEKEEQEKKESKKEKLVVALSVELPPYGYYEEKELVGIDVELAKAVAAKLDRELVVKELEMEAILPAVQSDEADLGAAGLLAIDERRGQVEFTDPYGSGSQAIVVKVDSGIDDQTALAGRQLGVQKGTTGDIYATDEYGGEKVRRFVWGTDALKAIFEGEIDAAILDEQTAKFLTEDEDRLKVLETAYVDEEYAFAVKKGNDELCKKVNEALAELKTDGTFDEIMAKYRR
ncbi:MAG: amino acid ABC transporter substrate-binding protein [Coprococcus sp.]|nr:amino acid ABC transporter substrate-binding protein [Coprococcus sp.]